MISMISRELLVVLARRGRIEIIRTLKSFPERDFTVNELARTAGVPVMTTSRAVQELKKVGMVRTRKVGNSLAVKLVDDRERLRMLRMIAGTDPQRNAASLYSRRLGVNDWLIECRLFGTIGRGDHVPGEEVDIAVVYDSASVGEDDVKGVAQGLADEVHEETNVKVVPLCISDKEMGRRGGLAVELREKEVIWRRKA
jgi:DNA-binding transcriptional ArsR family regulator